MIVKKKETIYNDKNEKNQCIHCNKIIDDNFYYSKDDKPSLGNQGLHLNCIKPYILNQFTLGKREIPFEQGDIANKILCMECKKKIDTKDNWWYNKNEKYVMFQNYHSNCYDTYINRLFPNQ